VQSKVTANAIILMYNCTVPINIRSVDLIQPVESTIHRSHRFFPIDQSMGNTLKNSMGNEKKSHSFPNLWEKTGFP
jgi:hypothetical protein